MFFVYGVFGVLLFVALAYAFYYGRVFAGGDAKLLMGLGGIFPFGSVMDYFVISGGFLILFFTIGVVYTLIYSIFLVAKNGKRFRKEFLREFGTRRRSLYLALIVGLIFEAVNYFFGVMYLGILLGFIVVLSFLFIYARSLEKSVMIKLRKPEGLTEGDWLEEDVKIGKRNIRRSVHGLSLREIAMLKKARKKVWIKDGIPFTPTFLVSLIVFALWFF